MAKKVLILTNNSGGLYCFRKELISALAEKYELAASTPFDDKIDQLQALGCRLIRTEFERRGVNPLHDLALLRTYRRLIREEKPNLVVTYTIKPNVYGGYACRLLGVPYAANITGLGSAFQKQGVLRVLVVRMHKAALKRARAVFFENEENRDLFLREGIVREEQSCLLSGAGVNLDWFSPQLYPHNDEFVFLFLGRVMKEKGIDELFKAMRTLAGEGLRCRLDVVGEMDEDYGEALHRCEAEGWLHYHGYQTDVRPFIRDCDCFVLPSWHEGMANTNLECASSGRPVITSNIAGCREAVADGESGFLCESKNVESLCGVMRKMALLPAAEREKMGLAGRARMERMFDKKQVVAETIARLGL